VPVLPVKLDDRLLFPLCAACARLYPKGKVEENYNCQHTDEQRGWVSTCTSLELNVALDEVFFKYMVNLTYYFLGIHCNEIVPGPGVYIL